MEDDLITQFYQVTNYFMPANVLQASVENQCFAIFLCLDRKIETSLSHNVHNVSSFHLQCSCKMKANSIAAPVVNRLLYAISSKPLMDRQCL